MRHCRLRDRPVRPHEGGRGFRGGESHMAPRSLRNTSPSLVLRVASTARFRSSRPNWPRWWSRRNGPGRASAGPLWPDRSGEEVAGVPPIALRRRGHGGGGRLDRQEPAHRPAWLWTRAEPFRRLIGQRVGRAVCKGTPMSWDILTSVDDAAPARGSPYRGTRVPDQPHVCLIVDNPLRDLEGLVRSGGSLRRGRSRSPSFPCTSRDFRCSGAAARSGSLELHATEQCGPDQALQASGYTGRCTRYGRYWR